jgi:hypothetical protein
VNKLFAYGAVALAAILGLASCGGGDNTITSPPVDGGPGGAAVATVTVLAASPQLPSDQTGFTTVQVTAQVKDAANAVLADVPVSFSATSGSLAVTQPTTTANGLAIAELSNGTNPGNRSITVTATAGGISGSVTIAVTGSTVTVTGPAALASGQLGAYTVSVKDSKGIGVPNTLVTVTSANGNAIAAPSLTTDATGNVSLTVNATVPGNDTLTVNALGQSATAPISISGDVFNFTSPAAGTEVQLAPATQALTVRWTKSGVPQVGQTINFSTTRGTLTPASAVTDGNGDATVSVSATTAGPAVITATNPETTSTSRNIEFVATTPASIDLQASRLSLATGTQAELIAIVRDAASNLVKNQVVEFVIDTDITGGALSVGSAVTDSQGRASSVYTGGGSPSPANGVVIRAVVQGTAIEDTVALTVAGQELFITLGTGNTIFEIGTATYAKEWVVIVTDVDGKPVANRPVTMSIRSRRYFKGELTYIDPSWRYAPGSPIRCENEDVNRNGILDVGEDFNGNGLLEPRNIASVVAVPASASLDEPCGTEPAGTPASADVITNSQGRARVCVYYPQNFAEWVETTLTARAPVSGSEFSSSSVFVLDVSADDVDDENIAPPNRFSPFGTDLDCAVPPPSPDP